MVEKRDWHSLTEAEQSTVLNRSAIGNIFIIIVIVALIVMVYRIVNDGNWWQPLIAGIVAAVIGNSILPDVELPEGVYGRSWLRSFGFVFVLSMLGAGVTLRLEEKSAVQEELAIPQAKAAVEAPQQEYAADAKAVEGPTFDETREWILAKYKKYSSISRRNGPYDRVNYNAVNFSDTLGKGLLSIDRCHIFSYTVNAYQWTSNGGEKETFSSAYYANFKLKNIKRAHYHGSGYSSSPRFAITFSTSGTVETRGRSGEIANEHSRTFDFYFNDDESEIGIVPRMESALLRLKDLAESNPDCADAIETF